MTFTSNQKGFTLIELLVVISIIGLLSSVVLASLNSSRITARNARRISDVIQLRNAFQIAWDGVSPLPTTPSGWACVSATCSGWPSDGSVDGFFALGIAQKPVDPLGGRASVWGYTFYNPITIAQGTGAYIAYTLEPGGICSPGYQTGVWAGIWVGCALRLDQ